MVFDRRFVHSCFICLGTRAWLGCGGTKSRNVAPLLESASMWSATHNLVKQLGFNTRVLCVGVGGTNHIIFSHSTGVTHGTLHLGAEVLNLAHRTVNSPGNDGCYLLVLGFFHWSGQLRCKVTTFHCKRESERDRERERERERESERQKERERERERGRMS